MNNTTVYQILTVHRNGRADNSRPRIQICGDWLSEMGFVNGALIQSLPKPDGFVFNLCNENINYSELFHTTKEQGGTLIRVFIAEERGRYKMPCLVTTGKHIYKGGLQLGDALIAKCDYGCIRVRKVTGNVRLINVAKGQKERTRERCPMVFLLGDWLNDIGFTPDTLVTVKPEPGCITFTAYDKAIIYSDVVKIARQNKMKLMQVSTKDGKPFISSVNSFIEKSGFNVGDIFVADYEYGTIKLQKFDPQRFGF